MSKIVPITSNKLGKKYKNFDSGFLSGFSSYLGIKGRKKYIVVMPVNIKNACNLL